MPALVPGIHVLLIFFVAKTWMAGASPAMTVKLGEPCAKSAFAHPTTLLTRLGILDVEFPQRAGYDKIVVVEHQRP
jgi:hypothetical protein